MTGLARAGAILLAAAGTLTFLAGSGWAVYLIMNAAALAEENNANPMAQAAAGFAVLFVLAAAAPGAYAALLGLMLAGIGGGMWVLCDVEERLSEILGGWRVRPAGAVAESPSDTPTPVAARRSARRHSRKPLVRRENGAQLFLGALGLAVLLGLSGLYGYGKYLERRNEGRDIARAAEWNARAQQPPLGALFSEGPPTGDVPEKAPSPEAAEHILAVVISNKRFDPTNLDARKFEDNIWWDAEFTATGLKKSARSIKGVLKFCDLFGDPQFQVRVTLDETIAPGGTLHTTHVGIEYDQFDDEHVWLRATEVSNMTFRFEVKTILYTDGATEQL